MSAPPQRLDQLTKVVVAFAEGKRLAGYIYNFSPVRDSFDLLPQNDPLQQRGTTIEMKDLKAIFFVKDFIGNSADRARGYVDSPLHGRKIEVAWNDGETILGKTEGFNPQKPGFFLFPTDERGNNIRIFVVNKNAKRVRFV
jgi:hypothetical protein